MTDLVEWLRDAAIDGDPLWTVAADEIERLRKALQEMIVIACRNGEPGLMLIAIRKCAEHALD